MSAPETDIESIAHLAFDLTPECQGLRHAGGARPPAQLWVQVHACYGWTLCIPCQQAHADEVAAILAAGRTIQCGECLAVFTSYRTLITRVIAI